MRKIEENVLTVNKHFSRKLIISNADAVYCMNINFDPLDGKLNVQIPPRGTRGTSNTSY